MPDQSLPTTIHYRPFRYSKGNNMAHLVTENGKTFIRDEWSEEDIQSVAECDLGLEKPLTEKQVYRTMELVVESFDANIGIDWEVIAMAIEQALKDEK
jgi:hypothetical protein